MRKASDAIRGKRLVDAVERFRHSTTRHGMQRYNDNVRALLAFIAEVDQKATLATNQLRAICEIAAEENDDAHERIAAAIRRARTLLP